MGKQLNLKDKLIYEGKNRWLDIGCGGNFEENFYYLDIFPKEVIDPLYQDKYFRTDIVNASKEALKKLGKFDFIRMQHSLEHFSLEEGERTIKNCARLLKPGGVILITTPDLQIHARRYLQKKSKRLKDFASWAERRISEDAPASFYFSIFAHGIPYGGRHKWCYDYEGIKYQLQKCGGFEDVKKLDLDNSLASIPFTHNRPEEDVCVIATKSRSGVWNRIWRK